MLHLGLVMHAQSAASVNQADSLVVNNNKQLQFKTKQLIIPAVLIGYGIIGIGNDQLQSFNFQIRDEVREDIDDKFTIDDFSQYVPFASVYALDVLGIKGKNNLRD